MNNKIGIDIISVKRLMNKTDKFLEKIFHPSEIEYYLSINNEKEKLNFLAGRWAAKEAIFKVINHNFNQNQILVGNFSNAPKILLPIELINISVSISHDGGFAVAVAIDNNVLQQ